jgi:hypothetical protein
MATQGDHPPGDEVKEGSGNATPDKEGVKDGNALGEPGLRINPEVLANVPELPGLDQIEVIFVRPAPSFGERLVEHVLFHLVAAAVLAGFLVVFGFGGTEGATTQGKPQTSICDTAPAPSPAGP